MLANTAEILGIKKGTAPKFADIGKAAAWAVDSINATASIVSESGKNVMGGVGNAALTRLAPIQERSQYLPYTVFMTASRLAAR